MTEVRVGQVWRENDRRMNRLVTVEKVDDTFVWVRGNFYGRLTRSRLARFIKAFTLFLNEDAAV